MSCQLLPHPPVFDMRQDMPCKAGKLSAVDAALVHAHKVSVYGDPGCRLLATAIAAAAGGVQHGEGGE